MLDAGGITVLRKCVVVLMAGGALVVSRKCVVALMARGALVVSRKCVVVLAARGDKHFFGGGTVPQPKEIQGRPKALLARRTFAQSIDNVSHLARRAACSIATANA